MSPIIVDANMTLLLFCILAHTVDYGTVHTNNGWKRPFPDLLMNSLMFLVPYFPISLHDGTKNHHQRHPGKFLILWSTDLAIYFSRILVATALHIESKVAFW